MTTIARPRLLAVTVLTLAAFTLAACAEVESNDRRAVVVNALVDGDLALGKGRMAHVAGRNAQMARSLFDFYRGSLALFARDWRAGDLPVTRSAFGVDSSLVLTIGDAHPENFGLLLSGDGSLGLEPNDFDSADRYPYLWDVQRLLIGVTLAARLSNAEDNVARDEARAHSLEIARAAAQAYAEGMAQPANTVAIAQGAAPAATPVVSDLFARGKRDLAARAELEELTTMSSGERRLKRGATDDEAEHRLETLPDFAWASLEDTVADYRDSLVAPPPADYFRILDAAREFGSGVASWPRLRVLVLVRGPSDDHEDDVVLELKELSDSAAAGWFPPGVYYDSLPERIQQTSRALWSRSDAEPLWGAATWLGFPVQVRAESEAQKTIRVARLKGELGTPESLKALARVLGQALARIHSGPGNGEAAGKIASRLRAWPEGFADEQARFAVESADRVESDWLLLRDAVDELGPSLGLRGGDMETAPNDLESLLGIPVAIGDIQ